MSGSVAIDRRTAIGAIASLAASPLLRKSAGTDVWIREGIYDFMVDDSTPRPVTFRAGDLHAKIVTPSGKVVYLEPGEILTLE